MPAGPENDVERTLLEICTAFLRIGLMGFGGVGAPAYRVIVDQRRWLPPSDYAALVGVSQVLPGANMINAAVILGDRYQGWRGSVAAVVSLLVAPLVLLIVAALALDRFGDLADVRAALTGMAAAAAGLVLGTGVRMARGLAADRTGWLLIAAAVVLVAAVHAPLILSAPVLVVAGLAMTRRARAQAR